jgi:hypothetical protein
MPTARLCPPFETCRWMDCAGLRIRFSSAASLSIASTKRVDKKSSKHLYS